MRKKKLVFNFRNESKVFGGETEWISVFTFDDIVVVVVVVVLVVFILNHSLDPTTSAVHPVPALILHPREIQIMWSQ